MEKLEDDEVFKTLAWFRFLVLREEDTPDGVEIDIEKLLKAELSYVSLVNELKMWEKVK